MAAQNAPSPATLKINFPSINTPFEAPSGGPTAPWYLAFLGLFNRTGGKVGIDGAQLTQDDADLQLLTAMSLPVRGDAAPLPFDVPPGASPYIYQAPFRGFVSVTGGTVSAVGMSRDGGVTYFTISGGLVPVFDGDLVEITYSAAPTITMIGS